MGGEEVEAARRGRTATARHQATAARRLTDAAHVRSSGWRKRVLEPRTDRFHSQVTAHSTTPMPMSAIAI
ncbi:hypothetical protein JCM18882A_14290 [Brevibacterium metallidurans]|uniref:Uncharacterized protein n=1 Tax=Brevibacterium metallidurans TaxID=1482676 RepID=A0ABP3C8T9_9MICO